LWQADAGSDRHNWGSGSSPVLYKNLVIVNASAESGLLLAFDKKTGDQVWKASGMDWSWSTPLLVDVEGKQELVVSVRGAILGFAPATGKELWNCDGIPDYVCPTVAAKDGVVYAIGGRAGKAVAVRAGGKGEVKRLWTQKVGSNVGSPLVLDE